MSAAAGQSGGLSLKTKEALIKTSASRAAAKEFGKKIDYYVTLFDEFYKPLELRRKNDNRIVVRLMGTREEFASFWKRGHEGDPPAAYFSPSLNALVLYYDPESVWLRQTLFHEASHAYLHRYAHDTRSWFDEGLAEYFEGWRIEEGKDVERRPALYDLIVVKQAIAEGEFVTPEELVGLTEKQFRDFGEEYPDYHSYLDYSTAWSITYYCLHGPSQEDRELWVKFMRDVNTMADRAVFAPKDWDAFNQRWKKFISSLSVNVEGVDEHLIVAQAYRQNGDYEEAIEAYEALIRKFPEAESKVMFWLGYCYKRDSNYRMARQRLAQAQKLDPSDPRAPYYLARIALGSDLEKPDPTEEAIAKGLELAQIAAKNSSAARYWTFLADCQVAAGDFKSATKTMREVIRRADKETRSDFEKKLKELRVQSRKAARRK